MDLDDLPKPSDLGSVLGHSDLAAFQPTLGVIVDNRPNLIILSPDDIDRWRSITQVIRRIPYYGFTLLLAQIEDISHCPDPLTLLWDCVRSNWVVHQKPKPCTLKLFEQINERTQTMISLPAATALAIPTPADLDTKLVSTYRGQDGKTRRIGYLPLSVANVLAILQTNTDNRKLDWKAVADLIDNWRTDWVPETSLITISHDMTTADGQKRGVSFVLAFGSQAEIATLLLMISSWENSGWHLKEDITPDQVFADPVAFVPIKGYTLGSGGLPAIDLFIPFQSGADPRVKAKADSTLSLRKGSDMLGMDKDIRNTCAEWGVDEKTMQTILRTMYLRVLPPTINERDKGSKYGTVRRGGNIPPDRYTTFFEVFGPYIGKALEIVANSHDLSAQDCVIPLHHLIANVALAIQGGVSEKHIRAFLKEWAGVQLIDGVYYPTPRRNMAKVAERMKADKDRRLTPTVHLCYLASFCLNNKDVNPPCSTPNQLLTLLGEGKTTEEGKPVSIEQQPHNRLPGWDSSTFSGIESKSVAKKRKFERKKTVTK